MYFIIGGPHMLGAFNYDYQWFPSEFERNPPILPSNNSRRKHHQISDAVLFYNQLFSGFLEECFGFVLDELYDSMHFVVKYFAMPMAFDLPSAVTNG
jgi:hypothetical protein